MPSIISNPREDVISKFKESPTFNDFVELNKRSVRFIRKCNKPDYESFVKSIGGTGTALIACGFAGYIIKVVATPILSGIVR